MVPEGWKILELGELAKFTSGGTPSKSNDSYWGGSHPWISGKDLKQHYLSTSIDMLTDEGFGSTNKAPAGSTLVLVRGMTLLKDFPVGFATRPLAFNQDLKALIPEKNIDGLFLSFLLGKL
ncbi:restriction endonuclease subunit S [Pseudomonas veronii]|uniref:restriction endonuclease subunit S n=1 Tax=Pseudomonas veronii TaxID=76761 RepID=UPI000625BC42|nr:restriction endonuclease subunit S [Pseudomonas veronii]